MDFKRTVAKDQMVKYMSGLWLPLSVRVRVLSYSLLYSFISKCSIMNMHGFNKLLGQCYLNRCFKNQYISPTWLLPEVMDKDTVPWPLKRP